jgi:hypothetical protein
MHNGAFVESIDIFFVGRLDQEAPRLYATAGEERAAMRAIKWWSTDELDQTTEKIFPHELGALVPGIRAKWYVGLWSNGDELFFLVPAFRGFFACVDKKLDSCSKKSGY